MTRTLLQLFLIIVPTNNAIIYVYFSPNGGCTTRAVNLINNAKHNIKIQSYTFTSKPIFDALVKANERGVKIAVILDKRMSSQASSLGKQLSNNDIPTWYDGKHSIAHNKLIIIDDNIVIGGSFNHTANAELHNAENMTVTISKDIAKQYLDNWTNHLNHSEH